MYSILAKYQNSVDIVLVIEPDSLPNLATNLGDPHCGNQATQNAYKAGIAYTINKFKDLNLTMYLDAAHGGWLGWSNNLVSFVELLQSMSFDLNSLRGFTTNVANYQALGKMCPFVSSDGIRNDYCLMGQHQDDECCADPCKLESQWNAGNNELNYVQMVSNAFKTKAGYQPHFVIDTGRNGKTSMRQDCSNWCNPRNAGVGIRATSNTAAPDIIDAYYWLKPPGESDGCTQILPDGSQCPRFDSMCASNDSIGS